MRRNFSLILGVCLLFGAATEGWTANINRNAWRKKNIDQSAVEAKKAQNALEKEAKRKQKEIQRKKKLAERTEARNRKEAAIREKKIEKEMKTLQRKRARMGL